MLHLPCFILYIPKRTGLFMAIKFIIDSASDITIDEAKDMGVSFLPLTISFDEDEYQDSVTLSHFEFYEKLIESDTLPRTSQVTPAAFTDAITEILDNGDTPIIITMSSALSGTYQSACIAASDFEEDVYVIDSANVCVGERLLIERGLELCQTISNPQKIVETLEKEKKDIRVLAVFDTLEYLKKGGRISSTVAFAGGVLSIKPAIAVVNGQIEIVGKARGSKNSNNLLRKLVSESNGIDFNRPYAVAYTGLTDVMLRKYVDDSADVWQEGGKEPPFHTVGCVIGTHVGPGAIAVSFFEK